MQFSRYDIELNLFSSVRSGIMNPWYLLYRSYNIYKMSGTHLCSHAVTSVVFSADQVLTIVFGMGTGVTPDRIDTRQIFNVLYIDSKIRQYTNPYSSARSSIGIKHCALPKAISCACSSFYIF